MEIDNTKKTKASTETESLAGASQKKKARVVALVDEMDPLFQMTKEQVTESLNNWFDTCDPVLRKQCFGWGYSPMVAKDMHQRRSVEESMSMYESYYKDKPASLLESDKALCEGICPLHVFHIAAFEWSDRPTITYGSYEQQVLFFVMKHNLLLEKKDSAMEKFVHRLLDLSYQIYHKDELEEAGEDEEGKTIWRKKKTISHITKIPQHQQAAIGVFFYPNLQFLHKKKDEEVYTLVCYEFKRGLDSFCDALQQLDERLRSSYWGFEWSHKVAGQRALDHALEKFHHFLEGTYYRELKFNEKPLTIIQEMAFCAKF